MLPTSRNVKPVVQRNRPIPCAASRLLTRTVPGYGVTLTKANPSVSLSIGRSIHSLRHLAPSGHASGIVLEMFEFRIAGHLHDRSFSMNRMPVSLEILAAVSLALAGGLLVFQPGCAPSL